MEKSHSELGHARINVKRYLGLPNFTESKPNLNFYESCPVEWIWENCYVFDVSAPWLRVERFLSLSPLVQNISYSQVWKSRLWSHVLFARSLLMYQEYVIYLHFSCQRNLTSFASFSLIVYSPKVCTTNPNSTPRHKMLTQVTSISVI